MAPARLTQICVPSQSKLRLPSALIIVRPVYQTLGSLAAMKWGAGGGGSGGGGGGNGGSVLVEPLTPDGSPGLRPAHAAAVFR